MIPTVKVAHAGTPDGYMVINESDLTDEQVLFDAKAEAARRKQMKLAAAAAQAAADIESAANTAALQAIKNATSAI